MRRRKEEVTYWNNLIMEMFKADADSKLLENRYRAIRFLMKGKHAEVVEKIEKEKLLTFIKYVVYIDRKMRLFTEGEEVELKKELSEEFITTELQ